MRKIKVAVVTNAIPNYRYKIFEELQNNAGIDLKIFVSFSLDKSCLLAQKNLNLSYSKGLNLRYKSYHKNTEVEQLEYLNIPFSLPLDVFKFKPDLIVSGEMGLKSVLSYCVTRLLNIPFSIWTEEINETAKQISWIQKIIRNYLLKRTTTFLAWGAPAYEYIADRNISDNKIFRCTQSVDNDYWHSTVLSLNKPRLHKEFNLIGRVFLLTGRLVSRKGFDKFFLAWAKLPKAIRDQHSILLVGDGEEIHNLKELVTHLSINNVHFIGAVSQQELPRFYAMADIFVFPSLVDVWGLVVNEALASGIPVLASKYAGATQELVCNQDVGQVIDPVDIDGFSGILLEWCDKDLSKYKAITWEVIRPLNYKVTVDAFKSLINEYG